MSPPGTTTQNPPPADGRQLVGTKVLGRYRITKILGVGGKGTVYEAEDMTMCRQVAFKVPIASSEDTIKRFLREGRAGASVAHPNVCAIYDFGPLEDGTPFLVMERLEGGTLADLIARTKKVPLATALPVVQQVLAGLEAAHAQGIVHRDIKPGNVFLTEASGGEPAVKILDFGASTLDAAHVQQKKDDFELLTKIGTAIGTPIYMAPEQVRGQRDLDARVDVYACGAILYEALTGVTPFTAPKRIELFRLILTGKFKPASEHDPSLPKAVDAVLARAMATSREDRYPNALAFAQALESLRLETLNLALPTPSAPPGDTDRLAALQQRLSEVSSLYLTGETISSMRAAGRASSTVDIPIDFEDEEEAPETLREPGVTEEGDDARTRRGG